MTLKSSSSLRGRRGQRHTGNNLRSARTSSVLLENIDRSPFKQLIFFATKCIVTNRVIFVFLKLWLQQESVRSESHNFTMFFSVFFQVCNMEKALRFTVQLNQKVQVCNSRFLTQWLIRTPAKVDGTSPQPRVENPSYSAPLGTWAKITR